MRQPRIDGLSIVAVLLLIYMGIHLFGSESQPVSAAT
jgi:hypothetical protein